MPADHNEALDAIAKAQELEREAASLSGQANAKLAEARRLRSQYSGWLEAEMKSAAARMACMPFDVRNALREEVRRG